MKRLILLLIVLSTATTALAFDPERHEVRIAVVSSTLEGTATQRLACMLRERLRDSGADAFTIQADVDDLIGREADVIVELASTARRDRQYGGIDVATNHASVGLGIVSTAVATQLRVYDAASGELLLSDDLEFRSSALLPTGIGLGGRHFFGWIGLPIGEVAQERLASRALVRKAADMVLDAVHAR